MLVNKDAYQRETVSKWPVRLPLTKLEHTYTYIHTYTQTDSLSQNPPIAFQARGIKMKSINLLTLKELGYFDPSHSRRGADSTPLYKISKTDWWNIKCVVQVDSYDPPESTGTKKKKKKSKHTLYDVTVTS